MSLNVGDRIKYVVEENPHADDGIGAPPGTYEGVITAVECFGVVEVEDGKKYRGISFTIECDGGQVAETSMFADRDRPLS